MKNTMRRVGLALATLGLLGGGASLTKADLVVVVTPSNLDGWNPIVTDSSGAPGGNPTGNAQFVNGPATPPLGVGSVNLSTGNGTTGGDGSAQIRNSNYAGIALSSITALSYSTYVTSNNGQQFPYLNLTISENGPGSANDKLYFEPPYQTPSTGNPSLPNQGATLLNTWQTWNALSGGWYSDSGYAGPGTNVGSLAGYLALHPNATLENATSGLGGIRLNAGFTSPKDVTNTYVDDFTIGVSGVNTTYDFEPNVVTPEPSTLVSATVAALACIGYSWRRRKQSV